MQKYLIALIFAITALQTVSAKEAITVALTSIQPPFVVSASAKQGLAYEVIDTLNKAQNSYEFKAIIYPTKRLLREYESMSVDLVLFNDVDWGWANHGAKGSLPLTLGRDVFISLEKQKGSPEEGSVSAVRGFHYEFANYDPERLASMKRVSLVNHEPDIIKMILYQRTEWGVISETFLKWYATQDPENYRKIVIYPKEDHNYQRQIVVLNNSKISLQQINELLRSDEVSARLKEVFVSYGLSGPYF